MASSLRAGAASVSITPREPVWMAGYAGRTKPSAGVIQNIFLKALALDDGSQGPAVIVTSDLVGLSRSMVDEIAGEAARRLQLRRERLVLNYSHNHSCPVTADVLHLYYDLDREQKAAVERYTRRLMAAYQEVIGKAVASLSPAKVDFALGAAGIAVNRRRSRPGGRHLPGPVDPDVPVLRVRGEDGSVRAIMFGYACHNTALGGDRINGDYAGWAQEHLERAHPGAVALFLMGCGGDINPLPRYQGADPALTPYSVELASSYGKILAIAVEIALEGRTSAVDGPLRCGYAEAQVRFSRPPGKAELESRLKAAASPMERREIAWMLDLVARDGKLPDRYAYPVQVWRFGAGLTLAALTGETVVDYSLRLKRRFGPDKTWVAGYNNDLLAYVPSRRVLAEGGYEGTEGIAEYGWGSTFSPSLEESIVEAVEDVWESL